MFNNATNDQLARIEEILRQLDQTPASAPAENRRRTPRINIRTMVRGLVLAPGGSLVVKIFTRNISTSGLGFVCRRPCKVGEHLALCFKLPGQAGKLVLAHITFARYVRAGLFEVGAEFLECVVGSEESDVPPQWLRRVETTPAAEPEPDKKPASKSAPKSEAKSPDSTKTEPVPEASLQKT